MAQFTLYSHASGPNGWKINAILIALGLTYEVKYLAFDKQEQKSAEHTTVNPNGRIPTLIDHQNGDFAIWESDAIMLYLVNTYGGDKGLAGNTPKEKATVLQWLFFQSSGQGAYFGQLAHFSMFAPEKIEYAINRYQLEVERVFSVLESVLSKQQWLAADHCTIADLAFYPWNNIAYAALFKNGTDPKTKYPAVTAWHEKIIALPYVAASMAEKAAAAQ